MISYGIIRGSYMRLVSDYEESFSIISGGKGESDDCISCIIWWKLGEDENQSISTSEKLKNQESTNDILKTIIPHYMFHVSNPSWFSWPKHITY